MSKGFDRLVSVMSRLRGKGGCPWDREQTHRSLKPFLIEEAYEVIDAIDSEKDEALCEELGDLLFQVLFHSEIAKEEGRFDIESVLKATTEKMTSRHPHVFSDDEKNSQANDSKTVLAKWEELKKKEPRNRNRQSVLDGIPKSLPPLLRAHQIQARASRVGFDWKQSEPVFEKVEEELKELREAVEENDPKKIENELGDLLFSIVNYARFMKINPEDAMRKTIKKFTTRFQKIELEAKKEGKAIESLSLDEMNALWDWAKSNETSKT